MLWERGTWEPEGDVEAGLREGTLRFSHPRAAHEGRLEPQAHAGEGRARELAGFPSGTTLPPTPTGI